MEIEHQARIDNNPDVITIKNPWKILSIILIIALIALFFYKGNVLPSSKTLSAESAGKKVIDFINAQGGSSISYVSAQDFGSVYEITVLYEGQNVPLYVTKDGEYFIQTLVPLSDTNQITGNAIETEQLQEVSVDDDPFLGKEDSPVIIIEFSDYQCPFCERFFTQTYAQLKKEYIDAGKVKFVFRDFPLTIHPDAQKAAEAAECAHELGGNEAYFKMHDKLFQNQQALALTNLKQYAKEIGLNQASFNECLDSGKLAQEVQKDFQDGVSYSVSGTPSFFINGKQLVGAQPFSAFKQIIDEALSN